MLPDAIAVETIRMPAAIHPQDIVALEGRIASALDTGRGSVVVDLACVDVLGTRTASLLCAALRGVGTDGATIAIVGVPALLRRTIELCDIEGVEFALVPSAASDAAAAGSARTASSQTSPLRPSPQ